MLTVESYTFPFDMIRKDLAVPWIDCNSPGVELT